MSVKSRLPITRSNVHMLSETELFVYIKFSYQCLGYDKNELAVYLAAVVKLFCPVFDPFLSSLIEQVNGTHPMQKDQKPTTRGKKKTSTI